MLRIIRQLLLDVIDRIDSGNSNISEDDSLEVIDIIKRFTDTTERLSKYKACEYLHISRASFDNYIKEGKLPKGKKEVGFKELSWCKKDLDEFKKKIISKK